MKCLICNLEFKSINRHLKLHNISQKEYYDKYFKKDTEGICITCGKETPFLNMKQGYQKHCSCKCAQRDPKCNNFIANNPQKNPVIKQKTAETNIKKYGTSTPNPFNSDKFKNNMIKIYGVENPYQLPSVQEKARKNSHTKEANEKRYKSLLDKIASIEKSLNVTYIHKILEQTRSSG